ncbi:MAG: nucleoside phosphorylase [Clostridia bacterium]|nr:nucleoside phosphorylase [Clostridia bacterium]
MENFPITDNFLNEESLITPSKLLVGADKNVEQKREELKKLNITSAVLCFFKDDEYDKEIKDKFEYFYQIGDGGVNLPIYIYDNKTLVVSVTIGGACASLVMEELSFFGITKFLAFGSAGCINPEFDTSKLILVKNAIRDDGASYQYIKPSLYVETSEKQNQELSAFLKEKNVDFSFETTWTTDAIYRETAGRANLRLSQGATAVEMECASWCAVAKYHNFEFSQILYFTDAINQKQWDWIDGQDVFVKIKNEILKLALDFMTR